MHTLELEELREKATTAFKNGNFEEALTISQRLSQFNVPEALFTCGVIYERIKGKVDYDQSYKYYDRLRKYDLTEGSTGCVRVLLRKKSFDGAAMAERLCNDAINETKDGFAYFLLGRVLEELKNPPDFKRAKKMYLQGALRGIPWGYRHLANLELRQGSKVLGVLIHVIATIVFPFYRVLLGAKSLRAG